MGSAQSCTALGPCDCRQRRRVTLYQSTVKLAVFTFDNDERDAHTFCNEFSEFKTPCFRKVILFSYKTLWEIVSEYFSCLLLQVIKNISTRTKKKTKVVTIHCKNRIVNMTCSLSFWLQMSEPITHIDTDNCMTIHHKGTGYFDSTAHPFTPLKEMISYHSL